MTSFRTWRAGDVENGGSYVFPMRDHQSLVPKGSNGRVVVKSVWFDAL